MSAHGLFLPAPSPNSENYTVKVYIFPLLPITFSESEEVLGDEQLSKLILHLN